MDKNSKIYIAGHTGLVGSALLRNLQQQGYNNFVFSSFPQYDLRNQQQVEDFFAQNRPEYVFLAAAKVGGIWANNVFRAEFIYDNLMIQNNIIHFAYKYKVKKLLFLGSSCIYPKNSPQPIKEEYLLTSPLEYTNEPYAIAKIAGIKLIESYNLQYGTNFIAVMPTNLYGYNDNFDLENSHVLPAMIRKMHLAKSLDQNNFEAIHKDFARRPVPSYNQNLSNQQIIDILANYGIEKVNNTTSLKLWGTGTPRREFLHSDDLAQACIFLMQNIDFADILNRDFDTKIEKYPFVGREIRNTHINIGCGEDYSISQLAQIVKQIVGFKGEISWDKTKPDGTPRKLLDVSKLFAYGWRPTISLHDGLSKVYENYLQ